MQQLLGNYVAVFLAGLIGIILVAISLMMARLLAPRQQTRAKGIPYECGMLPLGRNILQVHVRYYIFALLFLIFDVEAVFLFPWALALHSIGPVAFWAMVLFIVLIIDGLFYAWRKGVLRWR